MKTVRWLLLTLVVGASWTLGAATAQAQDEDDSGDEGGGTSSDETGEDRTTPDRSEKKSPPKKVREVVKGFYARGGIGYLVFVGPLGPYASGGNAVDLAFGGDIIDTLGFTLTVEGDFFQGINNGVSSLEIGQESYVQGDFRSFAGLGRVKFGLNFGGRKIKRGSVYFGVGGGVFISPSLRSDPDDLTNAGVIHSRPAGLVTGSAGIEYYTKLSHFSVGLDISFYVALGLPVTPMALAASPFIKYTF